MSRRTCMALISLMFVFFLTQPVFAASKAGEDAFERAKDLFSAGKVKEAVPWFQKSADSGHVKSQIILGMMYERGEGVPKNAVESAKWYRKAASQGDAKAQYNLGFAYLKGDGVPKNGKEAMKLFKSSVDGGNMESLGVIGGMYARGDGVPKDNVMAYAYLTVDDTETSVHNKSVLIQMMTPAQIALGDKKSEELRGAVVKILARKIVESNQQP